MPQPLLGITYWRMCQTLSPLMATFVIRGTPPSLVV